MFLNVEGSMTLTKFSHPSKARSLMTMTPCGSETAERLWRPMNASHPTPVTANSIPLSFCTVAGMVNAPAISSGLADTSTSHGLRFVTLKVRSAVPSPQGTGAVKVSPMAMLVRIAASSSLTGSRTHSEGPELPELSQPTMSPLTPLPPEWPSMCK